MGRRKPTPTTSNTEMVSIPTNQTKSRHVYKLKCHRSSLRDKLDIRSIKKIKNSFKKVWTQKTCCYSGRYKKTSNETTKYKELPYKWDRNLRMGGIDCGYTMTDEISEFYKSMQILM